MQRGQCENNKKILPSSRLLCCRLKFVRSSDSSLVLKLEAWSLASHNRSATVPTPTVCLGLKRVTYPRNVTRRTRGHWTSVTHRHKIHHTTPHSHQKTGRRVRRLRNFNLYRRRWSPVSFLLVFRRGLSSLFCHFDYAFQSSRSVTQMTIACASQLPGRQSHSPLRRGEVEDYYLLQEAAVTEGQARFLTLCSL